jgi:hypothetical protein
MGRIIRIGRSSQRDVVLESSSNFFALKIDARTPTPLLELRTFIKLAAAAAIGPVVEPRSSPLSIKML